MSHLPAQVILGSTPNNLKLGNGRLLPPFSVPSSPSEGTGYSFER